MEQRLIFATNNHNKVNEIKAILGNRFNIITLKEAGISIEIEEPYNTLEENATEKAKVIHQLTGKNCFSEDTGLEVFSLNGEPGVKSARYAGDHSGPKQNISKLLTNLEGIENRNAQFRTVISLILDDKEYQFEGICKGHIISEETGTNGFGYDAIFIPDGSTKTFAQMEMDEKNIFSHRKKATAKFIDFLTSYHGKG